MSNGVTISVLTATYNREKTLNRVFNSLMNQTYKNFEWIIIDDGSKDNTFKLVEKFKDKANFPIKYYYQENQGKHIAMNKALEICSGEFCTSIDSDDEIKSNSLEILIKEWKKIPKEKQQLYKGIIARCYNPVTKQIIGKRMKKNIMDCSSLDAKYKYKMNYEKWGLTRVEVEKEFLSPGTRGHFYPEAIIQDLQARKYIIRYIDVPLRGYYKDTSNALTKNKINKENIYLWQHNINNNMDYFFYDIPKFIKSFVGISMCGFALNMNIKQILNKIKGIFRKFITLIFMPIGYICYKIKDE